MSDPGGTRAGGGRSVRCHALVPGGRGETLINHNNVHGSTLTGTCPDTSTGKNGSYNFFATGTAAGPLPGTFTESGSFTTSLSSLLLTFSSNFTIKDSAGTTTVTGTKSLSTPGQSDATCIGGGVGGTELLGLSINTTYRATITGAGKDSGNAKVSIIDDGFGSVTSTLLFSEKLRLHRRRGETVPARRVAEFWHPVQESGRLR